MAFIREFILDFAPFACRYISTFSPILRTAADERSSAALGKPFETLGRLQMALPKDIRGGQVKTCLNPGRMIGCLAIWAVFLGCTTPASAHDLAVLAPFDIAVPLLADLM